MSEEKIITKVEALMKYTKKRIIDLLLKKIIEINQLNSKFERVTKENISLIDKQCILNIDLLNFTKNQDLLNKKIQDLESNIESIKNLNDIDIKELKLEIKTQSEAISMLETRIMYYQEYCQLEKVKHDKLIKAIEEKGLTWQLKVRELF